MDKNEQKIYEHITCEATSKIDFNQIANKVDYQQYKKEKKISKFSKRLIVSFSTFVLIFSIILIAILIPNLNNGSQSAGEENVNTETDEEVTPDNPGAEIPEVTPGDQTPEIQMVLYSGFIKDSFENNIGEGPTISASGPIPAPPVIDGYFNTYMDYGNSETLKPEEGLDKVYLEMRSFEYIYEVEYKKIDIELEYVTVYIEKQLAQKIYEENKVIMDAPNAAPLDIVNGSIVDWFYSNRYYDKDKVIWCQYEKSNQIYSEIKGYVCVGVYQSQQRVIVREIFSNTQVDIVDNIYTKLYFKNEGNKTLTPIVDKVSDSIEWHASDSIIDETNTFFLFAHTYGSKFDCVIDKEANTIRLETYAVQNEVFENTSYDDSLKEYHFQSNSVIIENKNPNEKLGETTYITYNYIEFVEILQELAKKK